MKFRITSGWGTAYGQNIILLQRDNWDDYGYKTTFHARYCDERGREHELGTVKIAKSEMYDDGEINSFLDNEFESLPEGYFSLWQTAEAYKRVLQCEKDCHFKILEALNDIAFKPEIYEKYIDEQVLNVSLFRSISFSLYMRQFVYVRNRV